MKVKVARVRKKENIKREIQEETYTLKHLMKILLCIILIFVIFYCITNLIIRNKKVEKNESVSVVDFSKITLNQLLNRSEVEYFVKQFEMPGVVLRWKQINLNLVFFDCAFELKETLSEEEYLKYQRGLTACRLSLYPDDELVEQRKVYFENAKNNALMENATYSVEKLFEEELLRTLDMVFEQDFCSLE